MSAETQQKKRNPTASQKKKFFEKEQTFALLEFSYSVTLVLPYEDAILILQGLAQAEYYDTSDYENPRIRHLGKNRAPTLTRLSQEDYLKYKMNQLLDPKHD